MLGQPQVQVRFGAVRELPHQPAAVDDLDDRQVDLLVKRGYRFFQADLALLLDPQVILVDADVLFQQGVFSRRGQDQVCTRHNLIKAGGFQEIRVFGLDDQAVGIVVRGKRHPGFDLPHVRLDVAHAQTAGNGDTVVAIQHEVRLADLIDLDRR